MKNKSKILNILLGKKKNSAAAGMDGADKQIEEFKKVHVLQRDNNSRYDVYVDLIVNSGGVDEVIATLGAEVKYRGDKPAIVVKNAKDEVIFEQVRPETTNYLPEENLEELNIDLEFVELVLECYRIDCTKITKNSDFGNKLK